MGTATARFLSQQFLTRVECNLASVVSRQLDEGRLSAKSSSFVQSFHSSKVCHKLSGIRVACVFALHHLYRKLRCVVSYPNEYIMGTHSWFVLNVLRHYR